MRARELTPPAPSRTALRRYALILILAVAAAGCGAGSGGGAEAAGSARRSPGGTRTVPSPSDDATAPATTPTATAFPTGSEPEEKRRCVGVRFVSPERGQQGGPHIFARPDVVQGWHCGNIVPGRECRIGWNGSYAGADAESYIRFAAWERGAKTPKISPEVGPLPLEGQFTTTGTKFAYLVGKVDKVRFYLELLDSRKVVIARSDTYVYNVLCKG